VNVNGGAIALGHPIGASGAGSRCTCYELRRRGGGLGAAALCGGGGQGEALLLPPSKVNQTVPTRGPRAARCPARRWSCPRSRTRRPAPPRQVRRLPVDVARRQHVDALDRGQHVRSTDGLAATEVAMPQAPWRWIQPPRRSARRSAAVGRREHLLEPLGSGSADDAQARTSSLAFTAPSSAPAGCPSACGCPTGHAEVIEFTSCQGPLPSTGPAYSIPLGASRKPRCRSARGWRPRGAVGQPRGRGAHRRPVANG
jgi:hypothetical protein